MQARGQKWIKATLCFLRIINWKSLLFFVLSTRSCNVAQVCRRGSLISKFNQLFLLRYPRQHILRFIKDDQSYINIFFWKIVEPLCLWNTCLLTVYSPKAMLWIDKYCLLLNKCDIKYNLYVPSFCEGAFVLLRHLLVHNM